MTPQKTDSKSGREIIVASESSLRGLLWIRHEWLLTEMYQSALVARSTAEVLQREFDTWPDQITIVDSRGPNEVALPERIRALEGTNRDTLQVAIQQSADMVLIEGKDLLARIKLSFIRAMGVIPLLVQAYQHGRIKRVQPLFVALERKGFEMPPPEQYDALLQALDTLH